MTTGPNDDSATDGGRGTVIQDAAVAVPASLGWRWAVLLFGFVTVIHALSPDVQVTDSRLTVPTAYAVLHFHSLALDRVPSVAGALQQTDYDVVRVGGRRLPLYPWPTMLLAVPATAAAELAGVDVATLRPSGPNRTWPIEVPTAAVLVGATAVAMALIALELARRTDRAHRFALAVGLIFAFGTAAWSTASRALWQHTPAMLLSSLALLAALRSARDHRYLWLLGGSLAAGFTVRPTMAVPVVTLGAWALLNYRREAWRTLAGAVALAVPFVAVNVILYHHLLPPYYTGRGNGFAEHYGFIESLGVQLVSPSRGLLIYTPMFLLVGVGVWAKKREHRLTPLDLSVSVTVVLYLLVVAISGSTGGTGYGNRLFTDVVPFLVYLCLPAFERLIVRRDLSRPAATGAALLIGASVVLAAPGALTHAALC